MLIHYSYSQTLVRPIFNAIRCYSVKKASSKRWVQRAESDYYSKEAKFNNYKSRAAYKIMDIDDKNDIFRPGQNVVDLGFAPGAWTQVAVTRVGETGRVLGVDIIPTAPPKGASAIQANILSKKTHTLIRNFFLDPKNDLETDDVLNHPSYIETELNEDPDLDEETLKKKSRYPLDLVLSDMYDTVENPDKNWNNTTNVAFSRMANTTGLIAKDHIASMVSNFDTQL